ncbi:type II toxin-antitoxin system RelE/ParE family toxin [Actinacidiphila oryziradicis]|uniref:Type II toxin-antitoxin system RelE/ParE family toxin n=1 Tax=Actinacidiphila oryziradicis TaxID=2571141 RepID=A0A4U0STZ1_9ACTN|nr:type II toxin-antitoxin system RelE/ParE family toxin [Actinacidiphila oryziradicis]TKA11971.1 type II toxin-antitoxin system RelE/ParE family toxin [Actinacidiphila oryziradicis]
MPERWEIELEPEVREWLEVLPPERYRAVERHADRLAESPTTLGEPYSRHLDGPVRELCFILGTDAVRISYWLAPARRIVLLTVFRKTRMWEEAQVQRALWRQKECESEHPPAGSTYHRTFEEQP